MKNIKYIIFLFSALVIAIVSCDDMNSLHQKYIDAGEQVYLSKNDSLNTFPGYGRVKLVWYVNADPMVESTVIYWNLHQDSIEKPFVRTQDGPQKDSIIITLPEGEYFFELFNKNSLGNRSLPVAVMERSYGIEYTSGLRIRPVANISFAGFDPAAKSSGVKITWGEAPAGSIKTKLTYKKRSTGEEVVLDVDNATTETTLLDVGNRLEHPDDLLYVSSVYAPSGSIDDMDTPAQNWQLVYYMASGTRIEETVYDGANTTFTYTYTNQDKIIRLMSDKDGSRVYDCNRVAEMISQPTNTTFQLKLYDDHAISVSGDYVIPANTISDAETASIYDPETRNISLRYKVKASGGIYTIDETLVPKTTPFEKEAVKPFGDMRASIPDDNLTQWSDGYAFSKAFDGIHPPVDGDNAWLIPAGGSSASFTIDLKETIKLTRMNLWPLTPNSGFNWQGIYFDFSYICVYGYYNVIKCEVWGATELAQGQDAAYWSDADKENPGNTYKKDWVYLGTHEIDRLDKKNATREEVVEKGWSGHQFIFPENAGPVRYIRFINRKCFIGDSPGTDNGNPFQFAIGELSFYGYPQ